MNWYKVIKLADGREDLVQKGYSNEIVDWNSSLSPKLDRNLDSYKDIGLRDVFMENADKSKIRIEEVADSPKRYKMHIDINLYYNNSLASSIAYERRQGKDNQLYVYLCEFQTHKSIFRRFGFGTILLNYVVDKAKKENAKLLTLMAFPNNPARNLYGRLGFKQDEHDSYVMTLQLN